MAHKTAVVVVDLQGDFSEAHEGSLAVPGADQAYLEAVEAASREYAAKGLPLFATQDWHPPDHCSFVDNNPGAQVFQVIKIKGRNQIMWPVHCVQDTPGAQLLLHRELFKAVIIKGDDPKFDSYTGFADEGGKKTGLEDMLKAQGIETLVIYGLATDYCVKATVLDALAAGFKVQVRLDLCRGVAPETTQAAVAEMTKSGAEVLGI